VSVFPRHPAERASAARSSATGLGLADNSAPSS